MYKLRYTGPENEAQFKSIVGKVPFWYHSFYFDNGYSVKGDWNIGLDIHDYPFPKDMTGLRVLDIGPASGWFSFYFEQLGADVTVVETRGYCDFDIYGRFDYAPAVEKTEPDAVSASGGPVYFGPATGSLWCMKNLLKSNIKFVNARAYEVGPGLFGNKTFDIVFMGAILQHLRDPIGALRAARSVCRGRLIATSRTWQERDDNPYPIMILPYTKVDKITWWLPNLECYRHWFMAAGFSSVKLDKTVRFTPDVHAMHKDGRIRNNLHEQRIADVLV